MHFGILSHGYYEVVPFTLNAALPVGAHTTVFIKPMLVPGVVLIYLAIV